MIYTTTVTNYNLEKTIESGQIFRFYQDEDGVYRVFQGDLYCYIRQEGEEITIYDYIKRTPEEEEQAKAYWSDFFALDENLSEFQQFMQSTPFLAKVYEENAGLRLLRQDPWEALICFIVSQQNNIPRIKRIISDICSTAGHYNWSQDYQSFPKPIDLINRSIVSCGVGYRADYIHSAATMIRDGVINLEDLRAGKCRYEEAHHALCQIYGVGTKIADCVCLFGLGHRKAFPVDVHIKRILTLPEIEGFHSEDCGQWAGYVQQYLYKYALEHGI